MKFRILGIASMMAFATLGFGLQQSSPVAVAIASEEGNPIHAPSDRENEKTANALFRQGRNIFRFDTFGSESFWGDTLKLHQAIAGSKNGGVGGGVSPQTALGVGLKVDIDSVPPEIQKAMKEGKVDLNDPKTTLTLLQADSVVGVKAFFNNQGRIASFGIQCALCHSTVDNSFSPGIGHRLDGWPNRDLNVGAIVNLSPDLSAVNKLLGVDDATTRKVLQSWGPGRFDAELFLDGKAFRPDGKTAATLLPAAFGLAGVSLHTYTGWGPVTQWNAFVGNLEMHGSGTYFDPRLDDAAQFPVAARNRMGHVRSNPDLISAKLGPLQIYQLSLLAPNPPKNSFDQIMAARGKNLFMEKAKCATCHVPPNFSEPGWPMHTGAEIGIDEFQAQRSPSRRYRTTPLKGLFTRSKGGFYHDGRFADLNTVVNHYNSFQKLGLSENEKADLVEYLKSL